MPKTRKYSKAYIDRKIAQIDEMYERNMRNIKLTPRVLSSDGNGFGGFSAYNLADRTKEEIKEYFKQFEELAYVRGFWMGWTMREGTPDETEIQNVGQAPKEVR